ncbi:hypothetical protein J3R83DRAFT_1781 [Lanmaoa asiatica]|nr:hypothetical protein J3R83DRAFT_1781 [Lanmaoa asiatica]
MAPTFESLFLAVECRRIRSRSFSKRGYVLTLHSAFRGFDMLNKEFDLVHNALFTDPDDQSAWIYHRWLIGSGENEEQLRQEITIIQELLGEQPDSKWCMDSLVYYNRLLLKDHCSDSDDIRQNCLGFLQQLEQIDNPRKSRYQEIAQQIRDQ